MTVIWFITNATINNGVIKQHCRNNKPFVSKILLLSSLIQKTYLLLE
jgi:hypothetical protein